MQLVQPASQWGEIFCKGAFLFSQDIYKKHLQAFLDFRGFEFRNFQFNSVYNSILLSSPLVLLSNLNSGGFCFLGFRFVSPY